MMADGPARLRRQSAWGRVGGLTTRARCSGDQMTRPARAGFARRFEREVDPNGVLGAAELRARADAAMRAHMLRLAERSAAARSSRAGRRARDRRDPGT